MLAIISPAKSLDFDSAIPPVSPSGNRFPDETERLAKAIGNLTTKKLKAIMPVSDNLIALNRQRYSDFFAQPERPAIYAYNGDVYTGFEAGSISEEAMTFAQGHLRILSGLYGLLRPLDPIRPHRLEMGTRWAPRYNKLTDFWKDKIAGAKRARVMMARYICENHLADPEALKGFDYDGYRYDADGSTESSLRFLRT